MPAETVKEINRLLEADRILSKNSAGIPTIEFKGEVYPHFQSTGFAAQYAFPFALQVCKGVGFDIGYGKPEWKFPNAIGIDKNDPDERLRDAMNLPDLMVNFVFSSHCAEHLPNWVEAFDHWGTRLKKGGVFFLYVPHYIQHYWRPWNNRKHLHIFTPTIIRDYLNDNGYRNVFVGERDLYHSFMAMAEKI